MIRFDDARAYGFISPESGGDDVFLHANDIIGDRWAVRSGTRVQFDVEVGERGPKAFNVRLLGRASQRDGVAVSDEDEQMCDVLTVREFRDALTELCIAEVPALTGGQIAQLRKALVSYAQQRGWIET